MAYPQIPLPNTPVSSTYDTNQINTGVSTNPYNYYQSPVPDSYLPQDLLSNVKTGGINPDPNIKSNIMGDYISPGIKGAAAIGNYFLGEKALDLSERQINASEAQWTKNFAAQGGVYNTQLEQQQRNRMQAQGTYADNPEQFEADLAAYVTANKVDTTSI